MEIQMITLIVIIFILSFLLIKMKIEIKHMNKQTKIKLDTNARFTISNDLQIKELNILCEHLNQMYEKFIKAELEEAKKEKEFKDMLSYIAHDVRTPLTSVKGYLQILQEESKSEGQEKYFHIIDHRLDTIQNLLEQFFLYAKLMNDDYPLEESTCYVYQTCCGVIADFYPQFIQYKIEPHITFDNQDMQVIGNKDLLAHVFHNLIENALRHGDGDMYITQYDHELIFSNHMSKDMIVDVNCVFERFYKGDDSRTKISSGLGLAIVKEIMTKMQGDVYAQIHEQMFQVHLIFHDEEPVA